MFSCRDRNDEVHILESLIGNRETDKADIRIDDDGIVDESVKLERTKMLVVVNPHESLEIRVSLETPTIESSRQWEWMMAIGMTGKHCEQ